MDETSHGALTVLIDAADAALYEALAAALASEGGRCTRVGRSEHAAAGDRFGVPPTQAIGGVWDGCSFDAVECRQLRQFARRFSQQPAPVIALIDSPRSQDYARLREAGASTLLGKPFSVEGLIDELRRLTNVQLSSC
jgi:DNA-binding response OmpR family regulator